MRLVVQEWERVLVYKDGRFERVLGHGDGRFEPDTVKVGREGEGKSEILEGLDAGTKVVASGQFLIDSEANLRGMERRMAPADASKPHGGAS